MHTSVLMAIFNVNLVLALESQHKGSKAPSTSSLGVDEENMTQGHWLKGKSRQK